MFIQQFNCQKDEHQFNVLVYEKYIRVKSMSIEYKYCISLEHQISWLVQQDQIYGFVLDYQQFYAEHDDLWLFKQNLGNKIIMNCVRDFYEFESILGKGGCGKVALCRCKFTGHQFAVKSLKKSEHTHTQIWNEIKIQSRVKCNNTASLVEVFVSKYSYYLVMEKLDKSLEEQDEYDHEDIKQIIKFILKGLNNIHSNDVIHRDIKCQNIMIGSNNEIKIIDFGLSIAKTASSTEKCGTPGYIAPEILNSNSNQIIPYSEQSDVFSVGVIMYQLYKKERLIGGNNLDVVLSNNYKCNYDTSIFPKIPDRGTELLAMMLQVDPKHRVSCLEALQHPFFRSYDQECIIQLTPMMQPKFKQSPDFKNTQVTCDYLGSRPYFQKSLKSQQLQLSQQSIRNTDTNTSKLQK